MTTKDRPILFSAPMVRALLASTKTQTRRIVKPQPPADKQRSAWYEPGIMGWAQEEVPAQHWHRVRSPYGQPGDRLWVREAWGYFDPDCSGENQDDDEGPGMHDSPDLMEEGNPLRNFWRRRVAYRATWEEPKYGIGPDKPARWRPSIHMPRWASRITLEVTDVRVERLQDISEADAQAEGIERLPAPVIGGWSGLNRFTLKGMGAGACAGLVSWNAPTATELYQRLWTEINGPESWDANPWVWAVSFRRVESAV